MTDPNQAASSVTVVDEREANLPPVPPHVLVAYRRMWRDPDVFAGFDPETWVAFSGETIVASAPNLKELHRILHEGGMSEVYILQVDPIGFAGI